MQLQAPHKPEVCLARMVAAQHPVEVASFQNLLLVPAGVDLDAVREHCVFAQLDPEQALRHGHHAVHLRPFAQFESCRQLCALGR